MPPTTVLTGPTLRDDVLSHSSPHGRVAVVDPLSTGTELVRAFRERGVEPLHVYDDPEWYRAAAADGNPAVLSRSVEETAESLMARNVRTVVPGSEYGVAHADALNARMGLDLHDPARSTARRNKLGMMRELERQGVPVPVTRSVRSAQELEDVLGDLPGYPVFVKPSNAAGSDGCFTCRSAAEVRTAFYRIAGRRNLLRNLNDTVVIQELLIGPQLIVNTVSHQGRHLLADFQTARIDEVEGRPVYRNQRVVRTLTAQHREVVDYAFRCLDGLGVRNGGADTEIRLTDRGPLLVEVNARLMGATISHSAYTAALGHNQADLIAERYVSPGRFERRLTEPYAPHAALGTAFLHLPRKGTVLGMPGLDRLRALPGFHGVTGIVPPGGRVEEPWLSCGQAGFAFFVHSDPGVVDESLRTLHAMEDRGEIYRVAYDEARTPAEAGAGAGGGSGR
ncbi:ATP-grasp domain-containing protein [Streptomyces sp. NPDC047108]|uniref:ATP-grasp domain-containing protein n=1 Tax=Streptomyces sp. NPDC047108 TaxID=3155025 RepID=UPI0033C84F97